MGLYIIIAIIGFGFLVFIHELGHYLAAKASGVKVEIFSIGWGKAILKKEYKGTMYQIGWLPFGGFCKMKGDDLNSELKGTTDEFYSQTPIKKIFISIAGVTMNIIFAFIIFFIVVMVNQPEPVSEPIIQINEEYQKYPAYINGLRTGDRILKINNKEVNSFEDMSYLIMKSFGKPISVTYKREGEIFKINQLKPKMLSTGQAVIGIQSSQNAVIRNTSQFEKIKTIGLQKGDKILEFNNRVIEGVQDFGFANSKEMDEELNPYIYLRYKDVSEDEIVELELLNNAENVELLGYIRASLFNYEKVPNLNVFKGIKLTFVEIGNNIQLFFNQFRVFGSKEVDIKNSVGGPIKIVDFMVDIAESSMFQFIRFLGMLSLLLGFMNLLPIPAVDGSYIVFFLIELITRKELNKKVVMTIQSIGMVFLLGMIILVTFNDILNVFF